MNELQKSAGILLLILAALLAQPYIKEFREWFKRRYRIMKRSQYRRDALRTNLRLYKNTGEEYYIERVKELNR